MRKNRHLLQPRRQLRQLRHVPRTLRLVWDAAPGSMMLNLLLLVIQGVLPVLTVYLTRELVDSLVPAIQSAGDPGLIRQAVMVAVAMGLVLVAGEVLGGLNTYVHTHLSESVHDHMNTLIHERAITLDLQYYESPVYHDQLYRASIDAIERPLALLERLGSLLQNSITLIAMAGVLFTFSWWMPIVLTIGTLPALWTALRHNWEFFRWRHRRTLDMRRLAYFNHTLSTDRPAAELRLFGLGQYYSQAHKALRTILRLERMDLTKKQTLGQLGASAIGLLTFGLMLAWMFWQALQGLFSLGDLAMFYQAMNQGQNLLRNMLRSLADLYRNLLYLDELFRFLSLKPMVTDPEEPVAIEPTLQEGIRVENVTFRYPASEQTALDDFNLVLPAGKIVAIVGENGAGKSTLTKLLCRFYDPDEGSIYWDGVDLRKLSLEELRRRITVLFQQPLAFQESAADNIAFGNHAAQMSPEAVAQAAERGGADSIIRGLPKGYDTVLGKLFGTTELSVGEWQRVALARAFTRDEAQLIILDEPTSAMDSWAESAWMERFRALVDGRTALIITHRFTTAMQADLIHVMVGGKIVESGSHGELIATEGLYSQSWHRQMAGIPQNGNHPADVGADEALGKTDPPQDEAKAYAEV